MVHLGSKGVIAVMAGALALLAGCAENNEFTAAEKAALHSVSVTMRSASLSKAQVGVLTMADRVGNPYADVYTPVTGEMSGWPKNRKAIAATLQRHQIDVGQMLGQEFTAAYRAQPIVPYAAGAADARFELQVRGIAVMSRGAFHRRLSPVILAEGKLIRTDGTILWQQQLRSTDFDIQHTLEEYIDRPEVLRNAFQQTARRLAQETVYSLHRQTGGAQNLSREARQAEYAREDAEDDAREAAEDAARAEMKRQRAAQKAAAHR